MTPSAAPDIVPAPLSTTPLNALHRELGARMVPFAGYDMPVSYPAGIVAEHRHCRSAAALFDVSHMGQVRLVGEAAAAALETLVPADIVDLGSGHQRYALFTSPQGGILDDLMVTRRENDLFLVVNAGCKDADLRHLQRHIGNRCEVIAQPERALLALQGPQAAAALARLDAGVLALTFLRGGWFDLVGAACFVTRSGYTGEDGFEISVPAEQADALARRLLAQPEVRPAGLGARDTLRLEAGLCLYGHDITTDTTPLEAGLGWAVPKVRRAGGARAGGYPGAAVLQAQMTDGVARRRVGLLGLERAPVREGTPIVSADGQALGTVTSGTLAPTVDQPIAMALLRNDHTAPGTEVHAEVRGRRLAMRVCPLPFVPTHYVRA